MGLRSKYHIGIQSIWAGYKAPKLKGHLMLKGRVQGLGVRGYGLWFGRVSWAPKPYVNYRKNPIIIISDSRNNHRSHSDPKPQVLVGGGPRNAP